MSNPLIGQVALGIYGFLLIVGGIIGYRKAGSRPSLIAGSLSGIVAFAALAVSTRSLLGFQIGAALAALMLVVFDIRYFKTRKFMPSGLLAALSLITLVILVFVIWK
ncbi:TMEM14 family protein [Tundrisphaera lichenicola]|uniref:TMEM14 family protein n=1 Tax=Tundrisphaera lichenicola TaxID=2029860 RepID=UPI003EB80CFA